jgi:hypothetical protein
MFKIASKTERNRVTREGDIQNLLLLQVLGVGDLVQSQQRALVHPEPGGDAGRLVPLGDAVCEVHDGGAVHRVAGAGQRDPQLLAGVDDVDVLDVVGGGDLLEGDEGAEDVARDVVQPVLRLHHVDGPAVGAGHPVAPAAAAEGDADGGLGRDGRGGGRVGGEAVGAEELGERRGGVEAGGEPRVGGGVGHCVADGGPAGGARRGAGEVGGPGGRRQEEQQRGGRYGEAGGEGQHRGRLRRGERFGRAGRFDRCVDAGGVMEVARQLKPGG